jgi:hypothetical protein
MDCRVLYSLLLFVLLGALLMPDRQKQKTWNVFATSKHFSVKMSLAHAVAQ